jgi:Putative bacterial sensory transduction regulator
MRIAIIGFVSVAAVAVLAACERQPAQAPAPAPAPTTAPAPTPAPTPAPAPAPAPQADLYGTVTGNDMVRILSEAGYDATLSKDNEGDPMIEGRIEGYKYTLFFYRCNKQQDPESCMDLQFHSSFTNDTNVNYSALNSYNRDNRFGQAFFATNGEIGLDMSATIQGGVTRQHIKEVIDWWKVTLTGFPKKLGGG